MEREPWESPLDDEEWSTSQESGDILFDDDPVIKLDFHDYKGLNPYTDYHETIGLMMSHTLMILGPWQQIKQMKILDQRKR